MSDNGRRSNGITRRRVLQAGAVGLLASTAIRPVWAAGESKELRIAYGSIGTDWNPHNASNTDSEVINATFSQNLVTTNDKGEIIPVVAESVTQVSDTQVHVKLRNGVTFSDGKPVTVEDVKYTLEDYLRPTGMFTNPVYFWLKDVAIVDSTTVAVNAKLPIRTAIPLMAFQSRVIPNGAEGPAFSSSPIGTGAYVFDSYQPNDRVVVRRNDNYWGEPKATFDQITFRQISDPSTRVAALLAGEVDFAQNIPVHEISRLQEAGFTVSSRAGRRTMLLWTNRAKEGPWRDPRAAQALAYSIDTTALNDALYAGMGSPSRAPIADSVPFAATDLPQYPHDPAKARELLEAAGVGSGKVKLLAPQGRFLNDKALAEATAGQLEEAGLSVELQLYDFATFRNIGSDPSKHDADLIMVGWNAFYADADAGLQIFRHKHPFNYGGYRNDEIEELLGKGTLPASTSETTERYKRIQELLWTEDPPGAFLLSLPIVHAFRKELQGVEVYPDERIDWTKVSLS